MASTNPARGMRDFLPADVRKRNYVINIIKEVYESYGFEPLETPAVENLDTLMGKYGEEGNQLIFKILKRGEKLRQEIGEGRREGKESELSDLALRYDLTVPLARVVANNKNDLPKFFKRYQIQPVWRADRPARGRFREFYQCDVDCIGSESIVVEAEIIFAVCEILERLGFQDFELRLNSRKLLTRILTSLEIPNGQHVNTLVALDKMDKIGPEGVFKELVEKGLSEAKATELLTYFEKLHGVLEGQDHFLSDTAGHITTKFMELFYGADNFDVKNPSGGGQLLDLASYLIGTKYDSLVKFDPSLARGLSYYTGTIMEIVLTDGDFKGSLGGGGRYDGLIGIFGKEQIPACGFSLGLERILVVMDERGMFPPEIAESTPADVMVTIWSEETIAESLKLATELRSAGLRVTVYPEADKLGKQLKYADSIKVPWVCVLGESEIAEGKVTIKNMKTGEQQTCERSDAGELIRKFVK